MAILAYVGIPGSGKSYEVVSSVILEHFKKGRRIVSNIEGVTHQKLVDYCIANGTNIENLGEFINVDDETCQRSDFFPYKGADNTICKAGDLICIDEVWRIFPSDKIHENHRSFLAEHRHFTDPDTGICCDLVVINQSIAQLPRFIKDRIEMTYQMSKLTALGMRNRYRVDVFTGAKTTKTNRTLQLQRKYDKAIFPLYKSYDGSNGKENVVDDRGNIFKSFQFKAMIVLIIFLSIFGYYGFTSFFSGSELKPREETIEQRSVLQQAEIKAPVPVYIMPKLSEKWRITGELKKDGKEFVILIDTQGKLRLEPRSAFNFSGRMLEGKIDGELVNYYSGGMK
ncbi:zonular occludens toxin family protein [Histophilus somni]|uniref:zonular occludens toxin family protein n=1 Tax=Histophilus somni TaxID=731 RepID=UPI00201F1CD2|nr:zonular occludens toxin domain-containing protein [Histophilus somni]